MSETFDRATLFVRGVGYNICKPCQFLRSFKDFTISASNLKCQETYRRGQIARAVLGFLHGPPRLSPPGDAHEAQEKILKMCTIYAHRVYVKHNVQNQLPHGHYTTTD